MPRVPSYGNRQVAARPLPDVRRTAVPGPEAFGAGFGRTLAVTAGSHMGAIVERERRHADQVALLEADNALATWQLERLYGEAGAFTKKGRDAYGLPEVLGAEFDEQAGAIGARLSTDTQRQAFAELQLRRKQGLQNQVTQYVFNEMQAHDLQETEKAVVNSVNAAVAQAHDPRGVGEELTRGVAVITDHAERQGWGPERRTEALEAYRTRVHEGVIGRLLANGQDRAAQVYYEETADQIAGSSRTRIEAALQEGSTRGESQRQADRILAEATSLTDAMNRAKELTLTDPELRDAVETRIARGWQIREQARREAEEARLTRLTTVLERSGGRLDAIPPADWTALTIQERSALRSYARAIGPGGAGDVETDPQTYYALMREAMDDREAFANRNLIALRHKLGLTEFKELTRLQMEVRGGKDIDIESFRTNTQVFDDILTELEIDPRSKDAAELRRELDRRVERASEASGGKRPTNTEVQQLADELMRSVVLQEGSWLWLLGGARSGATFFDQTKRIKDLTLEDIPAADRRAIETALRAQGRPVTPDTILRTFVDAKRKLGEIR